MKTKIEKRTLPRKMTSESKPTNTGCNATGLRCASHATSVESGIQGNGFQPPQKSSTKTPEPTIMCEYSATKKSDHLNAPYSVWKPPTRSASDSGMSNGWRFVSAKSDTRKTAADSGMSMTNQVPPQKPGRLWNSTTFARLIVPGVPGALIQRKTGTTES